MAESGPLLSIIIPSYNQGRYLRECLDSVLAQNYQPIEILVMDGASKDETVEVLRSYAHRPELRWWSEPDDGPASAVNKGLREARGEFASIQSADDWYLPGAFSAAMKVLRAPDAPGLVYGDVERVAEGSGRRAVRLRPLHDNALCIALCICIPQPAAFFRLALARDLGGWSKAYHTCDWELWLRMMFRTRAVKIDGVLAGWRMYQGQRTDQRHKVYESFIRMLDQSEDIRRAGPGVQRAARAGKELIALSFGPRRGRVARLYHLLRATWYHPAVWPWVDNKWTLLPGLGRLRTWLGR